MPAAPPPSRFWTFECMFLVNNNLLAGEVLVTATRQDLVAGMQRFFAAPRARVLLAEVLGAWFTDDHTSRDFHSAAPFVTIAIAGERLAFTAETQQLLLGDLLGGGLSRRYLSAGRALADDADPDDDDDDADLELVPFTFEFDAAGFLASLPEIDGDLPTTAVRLVRPIGRPGYPPSIDPEVYGDDDTDRPASPPQALVVVEPGWSDAEPQGKPSRFDPRRRFVADLEFPQM